MKQTIGKSGAIAAVVVAILIVLIGVPTLISWNVKNGAVAREEQIAQDRADIDVVIQKRVDALSQMINTVKDSKKFEEDTIVKLTQARSQAKTGNVEQSSTILQATAEAYPELKTIDLYKDVMSETATVENQIKGARESYNQDVRDYRQYVRTEPTGMLLGMSGYAIKDYKQFEANQSAQSYNPAKNNLWAD